MQRDGRVAADTPTLCLSFLVRQAWLSMRSAMDRVLAEHGLSVAQYATLHVLDELPGLTIADLARMEASTRQSANELLAGLAADGLVERRPHPQDGRCQQVFLTEAGRDRLEAARPAVLAREQQMEEGLTPEHRRTARDWLSHVSEVVPTDRGLASAADPAGRVRTPVS